MFDHYSLINCGLIISMLRMCKVLMNILNKTFSCKGKKKLPIK